jgi:hypothetical protein
MDPKQYLSKSLKPIAGSQGVDTVVEYISTFDTSSPADIILFLEETFGHNDKFVDIINTYCSKSRSPQKATPSNEFPPIGREPQKLNLPVSKKGKGKAKPQSQAHVKANKSKAPSTSASRKMCGCFATHHEYLTSCRQCGRIHCVEEGLGDCLYCCDELIAPCSSDVMRSALPSDSIDEATLAAYAQKVEC